MNTGEIMLKASVIALTAFQVSQASADAHGNGGKYNAVSLNTTTIDMAGMRIPAGDQTDWLIEHVEEDPHSDGQLYVVRVVDESGTYGLCPGDDGGNLSAIPLDGRWDEAGDWHEDGMTFACHNGVLAKCVRWGYAPWGEREGADLRAYHQTCSRMARADYCGDGVPHTQNGTLINMWDAIGIQKSDPDDNLAFEAAWTPDGAINIERTRYPEDMAYVQQHCPERLAGGSMTGDALLWNESVPQ